MARFICPDSVGPFVADVAAPQSWNFYAYISNAPLGATDSSGLVAQANASDFHPENLNDSNLWVDHGY